MPPINPQDNRNPHDKDHDAAIKWSHNLGDVRGQDNPPDKKYDATSASGGANDVTNTQDDSHEERYGDSHEEKNDATRDKASGRGLLGGTKQRLGAIAAVSAVFVALALWACSSDSTEPVGSGEGSAGTTDAGAATTQSITIAADEVSARTSGVGAAAAPGTTTHLVSSGISRGVHTTQSLSVGESYAGNVNDLELAMSFDPATEAFVGRVKNEAGRGLCNTSIVVVLDGNRNSPQSVLIPTLDLRDRAQFSLDTGTANFESWQVETDSFTCTRVASHPGETGGGESGNEGSAEGSGEGSIEGSGEGGNEGSAEGPGHEAGGSEGGSESGGEGGAESSEESNPSTPVDQPATGNFNSLDFNIAYDPATNAFRGTVSNNTSQTVCGSRLEVHMAASGQVIELGPTIPIDLAPGDVLDMVLSAEPVIPDSYSLHPESSPCP